MDLMDELKITILRDGTIKTVADQVSPANHDSAEDFLKTVSELAGGKTTVKTRDDAPVHVHTHDESHHQHH